MSRSLAAGAEGVFFAYCITSSCSHGIGTSRRNARGMLTSQSLCLSDAPSPVR